MGGGFPLAPRLSALEPSICPKESKTRAKRSLSFTALLPPQQTNKVTKQTKPSKKLAKDGGPNSIFHLCFCKFKFVDVKAWPFCSNLQRKHVRTSVVQIRIWPYLIFIVSRTHFLMWKSKDIYNDSFNHEISNIFKSYPTPKIIPNVLSNICDYMGTVSLD